MRATAELLAHFMGDGSHISPRGDPGSKAGMIAVGVQDFKFFYFYLHGFKRDLLVLARQSVGRHSLNFLS